MPDENKKVKAGTVVVPCPKCSKQINLPLRQITEKGVSFPCPDCKTKLRVRRKGQKVTVSVIKSADNDLLPEEEPKQEIIQKTPAWIVTFADLATLLLTFFVLMLSFANMDVVKFKELVGSVQERYGVTFHESGSYQAVSKGRTIELDSNVKNISAKAAREQLVNVIYDAIVRQGFRGKVALTSTDEGVRMRVNGRALFEPGTATLIPESLRLLDDIVTIMKETKDLFLEIEGHTDNVPVRTKKFPSNWELSVARASSTLEHMIAKGAPRERLSAAGFSDTKPLFDNKKKEVRLLNRRVEFLFKRKR